MQLILVILCPLWVIMDARCLGGRENLNKKENWKDNQTLVCSLVTAGQIMQEWRMFLRRGLCWLCHFCLCQYWFGNANIFAFVSYRLVANFLGTNSYFDIVPEYNPLLQKLKSERKPKKTEYIYQADESPDMSRQTKTNLPTRGMIKNLPSSQALYNICNFEDSMAATQQKRFSVGCRIFFWKLAFVKMLATRIVGNFSK